MSMWSDFKSSVRYRKTPFHSRLHDIARKFTGLSFPVIPGLHKALYSEWSARTSIWHNFWRMVYYVPMFKAYCQKAGPGLRIEYAGSGAPRVLGKLDIYLGKNVYMFDNVGLAGVPVSRENGVQSNPELRIGDNCYLAPQVRIMVAERVTIGNYSLIGNRTMLLDNAGKPMDPAGRMIPGGGRPPLESIKPVSIGDHCLIGVGCFIFPGTSVGDGVFVKPGSHVRGEIPPFSLVEGNPGKVVRLLPVSEQMREAAGEARVKSWLEAQKRYADAHPDVKKPDGL